MQKSKTERDPETQELYYDVMTFPIESFSYTQRPLKYTLVETDIMRPDLLMHRYYGIPNFDDIVFWLSNIPSVYDEEVGTDIELPRRNDVERFYALFSE